MAVRSSLVRKFAALLALFVLTMATGLGAAIALGMSRDYQAAAPLRVLVCAWGDMTSVDSRLAMLEHMLGSPACTPGCAEQCEDVAVALAAIERASRFASTEPRVRETLGPASTRKLVAMLDGSAASTREAFSREATDEERAAALAAVRRARALLDTLTQSVMTDARRAVEFGDEMRQLGMLTLKAGLVCAALLCVLSLLLMHRWVVAPVARLREGAERFAAGDLEHRVRVRGGDEIAGLTAQVNAMAASITEMQERTVERERLAAIGEMMRRLVHNIRNPLGGIRNLAELTAMRADHPDAVREMQSEIIHAVDRFNRWLGEVLDVTSPLKLRIERHEVHGWLDGAIEAVRPMATARGVAIEVRTDDRSERFDAHHLEHAVVALLTNALEAAPPGSTVRVRVSSDGPGEGEFGWRIEVEDEGPGVPEEIREQVFRPYFSTKASGTGIGLASANQVVTGHGGRIELLPRESGGLRCVVRLPEFPASVRGQGMAAEPSRMAEIGRRDLVTRGADTGHRR